jgi:hypothetical protein
MARKLSLEQEVAQGYLKKLSSGPIKRWQRRYFVIANHHLKYFPNEDKAEDQLKGKIDLYGLTSCTLASGGKELSLNGGHESRNWQLRVDDGDDSAGRWVTAIEEIIQLGSMLGGPSSFERNNSWSATGEKDARSNSVFANPMRKVQP